MSKQWRDLWRIRATSSSLQSFKFGWISISFDNIPVYYYKEIGHMARPILKLSKYMVPDLRALENTLAPC